MTANAVRQALLNPAELERLGRKIREVLPGAEFQMESNDFVLTITVVPNQPGEYMLEYPANGRESGLGKIPLQTEGTGDQPGDADT